MFTFYTNTPWTWLWVESTQISTFTGYNVQIHKWCRCISIVTVFHMQYFFFVLIGVFFPSLIAHKKKFYANNSVLCTFKSYRWKLWIINDNAFAWLLFRCFDWIKLYAKYSFHLWHCFVSEFSTISVFILIFPVLYRCFFLFLNKY